MKRRTLLSAVGLGAASALTGCIDDGRIGALGGDPDGSGPTDRSTTDPTTSPDDPTTTEPGTRTDPLKTDDPAPPDEDPTTTPPPIDAIEVGTREGIFDPVNNGPHGVTVVNDADESRLIAVSFVADGQVLRDVEREYPAGARLEATLLTPAAYDVEIRVGGGEELSGTVEIARTFFDCNASGTTITVAADESVDSRSISTTMGCPSSVQSVDFSVLDSQCGTENAGEVRMEGHEVAIQGTIQTPTPCYGAELARADHDWEEDTVTLVVSPTDPDPARACIDCVGEVEYEATVTLSGSGAPSTIRLVHERGDDAVEVATTETTDTTTTD